VDRVVLVIAVVAGRAVRGRGHVAVQVAVLALGRADVVLAVAVLVHAVAARVGPPRLHRVVVVVAVGPGRAVGRLAHGPVLVQVDTRAGAHVILSVAVLVLAVAAGLRSPGIHRGDLVVAVELDPDRASGANGIAVAVRVQARLLHDVVRSDGLVLAGDDVLIGQEYRGFAAAGRQQRDRCERKNEELNETLHAAPLMALEGPISLRLFREPVYTHTAGARQGFSGSAPAPK